MDRVPVGRTRSRKEVMIIINDCVVCGVGCCWISAVDGVLAEKRVCSHECLAQLESCLTKDAADYRKARGVIPWQAGDEFPEDTIR